MNHLLPSPNDPHQRSLWNEMRELAARYDDADRSMLSAVPVELILAIIEAGDSLSDYRRQSMIAAGALLLRVIANDQSHRDEATARTLNRLGIRIEESDQKGAV